MPQLDQARTTEYAVTDRLCVRRTLAELCTTLFAFLPRADQRHKGEQYLTGLLRTPGKKSIRNISAFLEEKVNEQSLHHFVNDSTWDWTPMWDALGRYLASHSPPRAWVAHTMIIPKSGEHSVGVTRLFCSERGQALSAQQAVGIWGVTTDTATPVNWRLHLPGSWIRNSTKRNRASIPPDAVTGSLADSVVRAYRDAPARHHVPERPLVVDARQMDTSELIGKLCRDRVPHMSRINEDTRLVPTDPAMSGWSEEPVQAERILRAVRNQRSRVTPIFPHTSETAELATTVRVRLPNPAGSARRGRTSREFVLFGLGRTRAHWPEQLWLTDMTTASPTALLQLSHLNQRVARHGVRRVEHRGIRDFVGRSFAGWHRHAALVSAAHTAVELAERDTAHH
ncbi:IS701 family transposase [Actinopolyspora mortivallis]|uniref:Transposase n=1 Tax=Actinopolyspora mortivallis TaxID=33906 RepID=A0A2T0GVF8_ACTMO|nr:transposase [Actinopolyspora mortivallis]PRW63084.1 transposase [Actinopolyspora mortivallis]